MRQVPEYLIIGNGRVARHFCHYLSLLNIPYQQWSRSGERPLSEMAKPYDTVFLLISDAAIESFIQQNACLSNKRCVHFSGSVVTEFAFGVHPLMTFGPELYTLSIYQAIPWMIEQSAPPFASLFPGLSNASFVLDVNKKAYYHALCVLSNNFTTLLWQKFFNSMAVEFNLPKASLMPIFERTMKNIAHDHEMALTGPLVRDDQVTIERNLAALADDPFQMVYQAFVTAYQQEKNK